ncbi:MAG: RAMP superfamily CRISPR-associated protein, partial [bacterium]
MFDFALRWVDDEREGSDLRTLILASTLAEWQAGRVCLGGNRARGLGSFWLENLKVHKLQITAAEHLIEFLLEQTPVRSTGKTFIAHIDGWLETQIEKSKANIQSYTEVIAETRKALKLIDKKRDVDKLPDHIPLNRSFATVILKLAFDGPFLSNDPIVAARSGFDHAPMLDCIFDKAGNPFISGASLRGAIRSRAEKIARTIAMLKLGKIEQANYDEKRQEFLKSCPSCDPLVNNGDQPLANCDARWRKHDADGTRDSGETVTTFVETEHLCLSCRLFGSTRLGSRLRVSDATWVGKEPKADSWKIQDFLAIDRFIGGGLDGAKFDAAPLMDPEFTFSVTLQNPEAWELGWMALVLRDLCQGEVTIGFGAAKGYGRAKGDVVEWQIGHVRKDDFPADYSTLKSEILAAIEPASEGLFQVYSGTRGAGDAHWITQLDAWIAEFDKKVKSYTATKPVEGNNAFDEEAPARPVPFDADTFLTDDGALFKLYGLPRIEE